MIEENIILSRGLTLLEKIDDVNSLKPLSPNSRSCIVVRLYSYSLTSENFTINPVQQFTNILTNFSTINDGILKNQVTNSTTSLLLMHLATLYDQSIGDKGDDGNSHFECNGFKIYNSENIKLLPSYEFLKGNFANSSFVEQNSDLNFQLKSSQRSALFGVGLDAYIPDSTTNLEIYNVFEKLVGKSSGIKSGQFIL